MNLNTSANPTLLVNTAKYAYVCVWVYTHTHINIDVSVCIADLIQDPSIMPSHYKTMLFNTFHDHYIVKPHGLIAFPDFNKVQDPRLEHTYIHTYIYITIGGTTQKNVGNLTSSNFSPMNWKNSFVGKECLPHHTALQL